MLGLIAIVLANGAFVPSAKPRTYSHRRSGPAQPRRGRRQRLVRPGRVGTAHRRFHAAGRRSNARPTLLESRRPVRPPARSSARPIRRIPISSSGPRRRRHSSEADPRFQTVHGNHRADRAGPLIIGGIGSDYSDAEQSWRDYNSAMIFGSDGRFVGRYDKIHLVPFGEYIPFRNLLTFAHKLTGACAEFSRGEEREAVLLPTPNGGTSLRHLHLLRSGIRRRGAPICSATAPRCWSTSATMAGTATPARPGST